MDDALLKEMQAAGSTEVAKRSPLRALAGLLFLLVVGGLIGGGLFYFLGSSDKGPNDSLIPNATQNINLEGQSGLFVSEAAPAEEAIAEPIYHAMQPFVVNLAAPDNKNYLQIALSYDLRNKTTAENMQKIDPMLRSRIIMTLQEKTLAGLQSSESRQKLMDELIEVARLSLPRSQDPTRGVMNVHFTSFVIQ